MVCVWATRIPPYVRFDMRATTIPLAHLVTIYERVFPFKSCNSPGAHREFLDALSRILRSRRKKPQGDARPTQLRLRCQSDDAQTPSMQTPVAHFWVSLQSPPMSMPGAQVRVITSQELSAPQ